MHHFPSSSSSDREATGPVFTEVSLPPTFLRQQRVPALPPAMTAPDLKHCQFSYRDYTRDYTALKFRLLDMVMIIIHHEERLRFLRPTAALIGVTLTFLLDRLFAIGDPSANFLRDFEDLYYALLAKIKDLHEQFRLRVNNGFLPLDGILHFSDDWKPDWCEWTGDFDVAAFVDQLEGFWRVLNDPRVIKPLDDVVKMKRRSRGQRRGLELLGDWMPGMIAAFLNEKFGVEV